MPAGFRIRPMRQNEEGLWLDILRDADPGNPDIGADFLLEWERDRAAAAWRCFIAETDRGIAVGTVGAWYDRDFRGKDFGCIRWLAVRPIFRRQGIAKACLSFALVRLSQWHEGAYVRIPADQPAAKALCRAFGFIPEAELP
jgi:GNAT superfamily N-acetyltransferase